MVVTAGDGVAAALGGAPFDKLRVTLTLMPRITSAVRTLRRSMPAYVCDQAYGD